MHERPKGAAKGRWLLYVASVSLASEEQLEIGERASRRREDRDLPAHHAGKGVWGLGFGALGFGGLGSLRVWEGLCSRGGFDLVEKFTCFPCRVVFLCCQ